MAYIIVAISMTLSDLQVHAPIADLLKRDFLYNCEEILWLRNCATNLYSIRHMVGN